MKAQTKTGQKEKVVQYLNFFLGKDQYAVDVLQVREIITYRRLTNVPNMPPCMRGVLNLRGSVVPVIDLAKKFGMSSIAPSNRTCIVIVEVLEANEISVMGILVDSVDHVIDLSPQNIEPIPEFGTNTRSEFLAGMGKSKNGFILLLSINKVLHSSEFNQFQESIADASMEAS